MRIALIALTICVASPAAAQSRVTQAEQDEAQAAQPTRPQPTSVQADRPGRIANSSVGEVGQRQTREQAVPNAQPMARISSRIANRVQNRVRNRVDRYYNPQADAASPFRVAEEQAEAGGRRPR